MFPCKLLSLLPCFPCKLPDFIHSPPSGPFGLPSLVFNLSCSLPCKLPDFIHSPPSDMSCPMCRNLAEPDSDT